MIRKQEIRLHKVHHAGPVDRPLVLTLRASGRRIQMLNGETVHEALRRVGIEADAPCNGTGKCGKCGVWVDRPEAVPETPHEMIRDRDARRGLRLACRLVPTRDLSIDLDRACDDEVRILEGADFGDGAAAGFGKRPAFRPAARVVDDDGAFRLRYEGERETCALPTWKRRFLPKGLAIDLGTTTLVVTLVSLGTGAELGTASARNPQTRFGHDVMTRIQFGSTADGLAEQAASVRGALNELVARVCDASDSDADEVLDAVVGGNTTMLQLAAKIDPAPLGQFPFEKGIEGGRTFDAARFGLAINEVARVYVPPVAHAFVGSDISAGLCAVRSFFDAGDPTLFIDIGTNGEIALAADGRCLVTSAAAGPALEGMGISSGMRAVRGAVEGVESAGKSLRLRTIGGAEPKGVCGSGVIALTAAMLDSGALDPTGRMTAAEDADRGFCEIDGTTALRLSDAAHFTQKDVRQVQLAKGAIRTAIDMLVDEAGVGRPTRVILAGGFGRSLDADALETIGMIPDGFAGRTHFAGNTSRAGCVRLLLDASLRGRIERRMAGVEHVSFADRADYMDRYVSNLEFPALRTASA